MLTDIEISQNAKLLPIKEIAAKLKLSEDQIEPYGNDKAKIKLPIKDQNKKKKLILVTSINPTPAGEGKSTLMIGLGDAMNQINLQTSIAIREPSMGPVMGMKGGAAGGGYAQIEPMMDINLNFTGDIHTISEAHNTIAALLDNSIQKGNKLNIDPRKVTWTRSIDVNDRELRQMVIGLGGASTGVPRQSSFEITAASELMAVLCLSNDLNDLKNKVYKILIAYTYDNKPITVGDLKIQGAIAIILKDAIKPNLVQTLEHTPAYIHGGPFANIAHGCNSILATKASLNTSDYTLTESGFGSDLGAQKFMDLVSPKLDKTPDTIVIVATVRALKFNGGQAKDDLNNENLDALKDGVKNLKQHVKAMKNYNTPIIVTINKFYSDTDQELEFLTNYVKNELKVDVEIANVYEEGCKGAIKLAEKVKTLANEENSFNHIYEQNDDVETKLNKIITKIYGGKGIELSSKAKKDLALIKQNNWDKMDICIAKTQYSLSDDPKKLGAPNDFTIQISSLVPKLGANFIVAMTGKIITMPGLPTKPAALDMDIDEDGKIKGLF